MAIDLHRIFPGISARGLHEHDKHFIYDISFVFDMSVMDRMAFAICQSLFPFICLVGYANCVRPADPDDPDPGI